MAPSSLDSDKPFEQPQAFVEELRVSEGDPSGDAGLGQPGIVVGKPALRPGPAGLEARAGRAEGAS